jgi:hypothetical protein
VPPHGLFDSPPPREGRAIRAPPGSGSPSSSEQCVSRWNSFLSSSFSCHLHTASRFYRPDGSTMPATQSSGEVWFVIGSIGTHNRRGVNTSHAINGKSTTRTQGEVYIANKANYPAAPLRARGRSQASVAYYILVLTFLANSSLDGPLDRLSYGELPYWTPGTISCSGDRRSFFATVGSYIMNWNRPPLCQI